MRGGERRQILLATALAVGVGVTACSFLESVGDDQCATDGDCTSRGFAGATCVANVCTRPTTSSVDAQVDAGGPWGCLGHVVAPTAPSTPVTLTFPFLNAVNDSPIEGVTISACSKLDLTCASPVAPATTTDVTGTFSLLVPGGFDGYLQVGWSQSYPTAVYINPPATDDTPRHQAALVTSAEFGEVVAIAGNGVGINAAEGHLFLGISNCLGTPGGGVAISLDATASDSVETYIIGDLPSRAATATDDSGNFVAVNLPTGPLSATATLQATGQVIGTATGTITAGQFTYFYLVPTP